MTEGGDKQGPVNDNDAPDGEGRVASDAAMRLDAVVFSIARLIGRQLAREHFEVLCAVNDNAPIVVRRDSEDGSPGSDNEE